MQIEINNQADIANKYLRFAKWKLRRIHEKFEYLLYAEVLISKEGSGKVEYKIVTRLGVPGHDIILNNRSSNIKMLWKTTMQDVQRYLRRYKQRATKSRVQY
ncbi:MAG: hypothetical protein AAGG75_19515 [Bacteroidota bacterium]